MKRYRDVDLSVASTGSSGRRSALVLNRLWLQILGAFFCAYAAFVSMPWQPEGFSFGLDESYKVAINYAFAKNVQFGSDFIYTYGPYGVLWWEKLFPETYNSAMAGRFFLGLAMGAGLWTILMACWRRQKGSAFFLIPFLFFFPGSGMSMDTFYIVLTVLPLLAFFYVEEVRARWLSPTLSFLVISVSLVGLIKQTYLTLGVAVMLAIAIGQIWRRRSPPTYLFVYLAGLLSFWLLAGQDVRNIGAYLANAAQIVKGFSATMGLPGPTVDILLYLVGAGSFFALVVLATWRDRHRSELLSVAVLALVLFLVFKSAFVRHDAGHVEQSVVTSIPIACLYSALLWPELTRLVWRPFWRTVPLVAIAWVLLLVNAQYVFATYPQISYSQYYAIAARKTVQSFLSARSVLSGDLLLPSLYQDSLDRVKVANPLPELSGTTDLYPNELAVVLAHDLPYQPRPTIQSFTAYTGELAEINAAHLRSEDAAENVLFDIKPIDERLPAAEDGLSWPELLTRYDIADMTGSFIVLKRKTAPEDYTLTPISTETVALQDWVEVPNGEGAIWAEVEVGPSLIGKLRTTLFKLSPLFMEVELASGATERYRVFPEVMQAGQLVSPLVSDRSDFAYLASSIWQDALATSSVRRLRLVTEGRHPLVYPRRWRIRFSRFDFPHQDLMGVPGWSRLSGLAALERAQVVNSDDRRLEARNGPGGKPVLLAHADTRVVMNFPVGAKTLSLGYGILDAAWEAASNSSVLDDGVEMVDGVMFRAVAVGANGVENVLFSRWVDPHQNEGDRGEKEFKMDLSQVSADELVLETLSGPAQNSQWDWAYWSRFELESE